MDEGTFFTQLLGQVNVIAVAFAITTTTIIKYFLLRPPAPGTIDPLPTPAWAQLVERAIPLMPIFFATFYVLFMGYLEMRYGVVQAKITPERVTGWTKLVSQGVVSGAMAGYLFRVWKVSILGK